MKSTFTKTAIGLALAAFTSASMATTQTEPCDTAAANAAGREAAVNAAYADISTVRATTAGTANDGYAASKQQRDDAQRCMFDASDAMGSLVKGGNLSGLVGQLNKLLSDENGGCLTDMTALTQAAQVQATKAAQQQAQQVAQQAASEVNTQANAPLITTQQINNSVMSQQQINQAWQALGNSINSQ